MLARQHYRDVILCPLCGLPKEVCRAYDTDGNVEVTHERCHVMAAVARKQRLHQKDETVEVPESLAYSISVKT